MIQEHMAESEEIPHRPATLNNIQISLSLFERKEMMNNSLGRRAGALSMNFLIPKIKSIIKFSFIGNERKFISSARVPTFKILSKLGYNKKI